MDATKAMDVLLVEDNPQDAELTIRELKRHHLANNIFVVEDGAEALDFLFCRGTYATRDVRYPPKVILLDLKLPKMGGLEVLRALKENEHTLAVPVVIVTSSREDPDVKAAYALGANSYVVKPVDFQAFASAMSQLGLYWLLVNQAPV